MLAKCQIKTSQQSVRWSWAGNGKIQDMRAIIVVLGSGS